MERQIADMTLRILEARGGAATPIHPHDHDHDPPPPRRRIPFDPVADSINTAEKPRPPSAASQHDAGEPLRTALLRTNTDAEGRRLLTSLPVHRAWKGPALDPSSRIDDAVTEAVMVYERGRPQPPDQTCSRCRRGHGASPECVRVDAFRDGACSNCLLSRASPGVTSRPSPSRDFSPARRYISAAAPPATASREDMAAVWKVIAGVLATQRDDCRLETSSADDSGPPAAARRIEDAALLVARSADEWGHAVEDGDEAATRAKGRRRTEGERAKLVTQASRIRDTALRIAECARSWGEQQAAAAAAAAVS